MSNNYKVFNKKLRKIIKLFNLKLEKYRKASIFTDFLFAYIYKYFIKSLGFICLIYPKNVVLSKLKRYYIPIIIQLLIINIFI